MATFTIDTENNTVAPSRTPVAFVACMGVQMPPTDIEWTGPGWFGKSRGGR
jgi:hypothetical protein